MRAHKGLENPTVIGDAEVKEFMSNHEVLEAELLICQVVRERHDAAART
jgi:hypothetical protein